MRQVLVQVPRGQGERVLALAHELDGVNLIRLEGQGAERAEDLVLVHVSNRSLERLVDRLDEFDGVRISFLPQGALALHPPADDTPKQVTDVEARSPFEVFLAGRQSIGSWKGFLGYATAGGAVAWVGLYTNTIYLLVAAMLIAPYAGPAMNAALATARGDLHHLGRSLGRYVAALAVTILVAALMSLVMRQKVATGLMVDVGAISAVALVLPLVAGAAGALHLSQSPQSSLVSGAAVGLLVAASLAPPAALVGMAAVLQQWGLVWSSVYVLLLQLVGINLAGAIVFRLFGLKPRGARFEAGRRGVFPVVLALTTLCLVGLLAWQFHAVPDLQRSTLESRAVADVREVVAKSGLGHVVEADARYTRADIPGMATLLVTAFVQRAADVELADAEVEARLRELVQERLVAGAYGAVPLVDVTVLAPP